MESSDSDGSEEEMESSDSDGSQEEDEHIAKRLKKGSIAVEAFSCGVCAQLLTPPIFQCSSGPLICSSCHDNLLDKSKCPSCSGCALARSLGMERAARSIVVDCRYAERGCTEKTAYYDRGSHEKACPHAPPCQCPEPGCGFGAGSHQELLDHLTGHHGWPSTKFGYFEAFDLRVDEPGAQILCCEEDGQLFLVNVKATAQPPGRVLSVVGVPPYVKATGYGCRVEFSLFRSHRGTTALDDIQPLRLSDWPPTTEFLCVLPQQVTDAAVVPTVSTMFVCDWLDEDESDDNSSYYVKSDEDDTDSDCS